MDKEKIIEILKKRVRSENDELQRQISLYEKDKRYAKPDYSYTNGRISAFKETIELIGMLNKKNNK